MGFFGAPFLNFAVHALHVRPSGRETIRAECSVSLRCAHEDALRLIRFGGKLLLVLLYSLDSPRQGTTRGQRKVLLG